VGDAHLRQPRPSDWPDRCGLASCLEPPSDSVAFPDNGARPNAWLRHRLRTGAWSPALRAWFARCGLEGRAPSVTVFLTRPGNASSTSCWPPRQPAASAESAGRLGIERLSLPYAPPGSWPGSSAGLPSGARGLDRRFSLRAPGQRAIQPDHQRPCCSWPQYSFCVANTTRRRRCHTQANAAEIRASTEASSLTETPASAIGSEHVWDRRPAACLQNLRFGVQRKATVAKRRSRGRPTALLAGAHHCRPNKCSIAANASSQGLRGSSGADGFAAKAVAMAGGRTQIKAGA